MFEKMRSYILEEELTITIFKDKVNIVNYDNLGMISSNKIVVNYGTGKAIINGQKLVITRLLDDEVLIVGQIARIEFGEL
ncbi:MAG: YabP/YqfC family sporulation protein [Bacilli bacterium]